MKVLYDFTNFTQNYSFLQVLMIGFAGWPEFDNDNIVVKEMGVTY